MNHGIGESMHHLPMPHTGRLLVQDHEHMDALIERLRNEIHCGDWSMCQSTWNRFERDLVEHMDAEEKHLLPMFEREHRDEAAALREEHHGIRKMLVDLGIRLEIHALREQDVRAFLDLLQAHAAREERLFYRSAKELPPDIGEALARRYGSSAATTQQRESLARRD